MEYLKLEDLKEYYYLNNLKLSPKGTNSALTAHKANDRNEYNTVIYVDKGDGYYPLTNLKGHAGQYIWLDEENILFSEIRDEKDREKIEKGYELTCFYRININGGEAEEAFKIGAVVSDIRLLSEDCYVVTELFDNNRPCLKDKTDEEADAIMAEYKKERDYQIVDELPYWFNGQGFTNKKRRRLSLYSPQKGLEPLIENLTNVSYYKLSDCKKYIAYTGSMSPAEIYKQKSNIMLLNLETREEKKLLEEDMKVSIFAFWQDKLVAALGDDTFTGLHEHPDFYIIDPATGDRKKLLAFDRTIGMAAGSDAKFGGGTTEKVVGDSYYFTSLDGYTTELYRLDLNCGSLEQVTEWKGNIDYFDICGDRIVVGAMLDNRLQEIYEVRDGLAVQKTSFNEEIRNTRKYSQPLHHTITDKEGVEFDGWVIKPVDYEAGKKYPAILNIHGGPKTAYGESFFHEMQYWANQNYFVLFANPRGSDGKGNTFGDIRGQYGMIDYENLMQFVDEMLVLYPDIDEKRLGVTGGSYGGFMTNWIIGHTDRFAAAATQRSISNWVSMGYISDIGYYFAEDQIQADPWRNIDKVWSQSPLKYIDKATTPTLIIHSDQDYRCPLAEGYQLFTALKLFGVETKMCIFHGENHELSRSGKPEHRIRRLKEITDWMDKYLK